MPNWRGVPIPEPSQVKIPNSIPQNFNWNSYVSDPTGTFNRFKGARETHRLNWKGYRTATANTKKILASSPSKKFISDAAKRIKDLKKSAKATKELADKTKKASDIATKVNETLLKNVPGSAVLDKASRIGGILGIFAAIGTVALLKLQEFLSSRAFDNLDSINIDLTKTNQLAVQNGLKLKSIQSKVDKFDKELNTNAKDYARLNKQTEKIGQDVVAAKKQANDALYETREGRKTVTGLAESARKLANDALYETREGRKTVTGLAESARKLANDTLYEFRQNKAVVESKITQQRLSFDAKIQSINASISKFNNSVSDTFQKSVNATISKLQSDLAATRAQLSAVKPTTADSNSVTANAIAAAKALVAPLQSQISNVNNIVNAQSAQIPVLANSVSNLAKTINTVDNKADAAMNEARNKGVPNLAPLQQQLDDKFNRFVSDNNKALGIQDLEMSNLSKEFDKKLADFNRLNNLTSEQRFQQFKNENDKALGVISLGQSNLSQEFDQRFADFKRQNDLTADQRFEQFQRENQKSLGLLKGDVQQLDRDIDTTKSDITKIDTRLKDQEKVNSAALPKLDQILGFLPLIPARAADAIRPDIPTIPQIETAAATGTCRTTQPGGCMRKALKDNAADITNNNNTNAANILDALNTGANAALLQGQQTILQRLGDQLPGGIGGKLSRFADWMHLDRVLNILIFAATVHNALMLSNDIGQTLLGALNNVLQLIGLKKENGEAFDIGSVISGSIENLIKNAIGADNYTELKETWAKANRIYQATTNVLNSFLNLSQTILQASELIAAYTGKIGNALKKGGVLLQDAYGWMNPQPKFNRVTQFLEGLQNGANTIQMVTQVPLDVVNATTEFTTASTEFVKAIKEDDKPENKATPTPEPDELKAKEQASKANSQPNAFDFSDLFDGED
ncbi:MAG: hypothetical protein V7K47_02215 [Nostoc sp.]